VSRVSGLFLTTLMPFEESARSTSSPFLSKLCTGTPRQCARSAPDNVHVQSDYIQSWTCLSLALVQAIAIAALYLACKLDSVSGSGYSHGCGTGEDPFPDKDRGSLAVLVKESLRWVADVALVHPNSHPHAVRPSKFSA
jgi:hypothetical protein